MTSVVIHEIELHLIGIGHLGLSDCGPLSDSTDVYEPVDPWSCWSLLRRLAPAAIDSVHARSLRLASPETACDSICLRDIVPSDLLRAEARSLREEPRINVSADVTSMPLEPVNIFRIESPALTPGTWTDRISTGLDSAVSDLEAETDHLLVESDLLNKWMDRSRYRMMSRVRVCLRVIPGNKENGKIELCRVLVQPATPSPFPEILITDHFLERAGELSETEWDAFVREKLLLYLERVLNGDTSGDWMSAPDQPRK